MPPRGVCLPDLSVDDAEQALQISVILWRCFTFMRAIPLECQVDDDRKHVTICLAILRQILVMFPSPQWFKDSLVFSFHRIDSEAGWEALRRQHFWCHGSLCFFSSWLDAQGTVHRQWQWPLWSESECFSAYYHYVLEWLRQRQIQIRTSVMRILSVLLSRTWILDGELTRTLIEEWS